MKVGIIAAGYPPDVRGGGEFSSKFLAESLFNAGAQVDVLACGAEARDETECGVKVRRIRSPNLYWSFKPETQIYKKLVWEAAENLNPVANIVIRKFLKQTRPDILLTSTTENFGAECWRAPARLGIKTAHILRSYYAMCRRATAFKNDKNCLPSCGSCKLGSIGRRAASQLVDGVIGLSRESLDRHLNEGLFQHAISTVIPNPIPEPDIVVEPRRLTRAMIFGYLGFLTPNKGIELIADALRSDPSLRDCRVVIAGKGDPAYVDSLKAKFAGLNAEFVGWRDSHAFLSEIDFLIVSSVFMEPFGRVVAEAFMAGVPVIGSRIGGIGEIIKPGRNGVLFEPGDFRSIGQALMAAVQIDAGTYHKWSANALVAAKQYSGPVIAQRALAFFRTVLSETGSPATQTKRPLFPALQRTLIGGAVANRR